MAEINGTSGNDVLNGTGDSDILRGLAGNDTLNGGAGADRLEGGSGDDTYYIDSAGDLVVELVGEGFDVVFSSVSYALAAGQHVELLSAADSSATTALNFTGNELANIIYGNAGANVLVGGGGGDVLHGLAGNDTYYLYDAQSVAYESSGNGFDVIFSTVSYALGAGVHVELISAIDSSATTALNFVGNELANIIYGNAGANVLVGGGGGDVLHGLAGADTYYLYDAQSTVHESANNGFDVIFSSVSYALGAGVHVELLSADNSNATTSLNFVGNELANIIYGNAGANVLVGGGGGDTLYGLGGDDTYYVYDALSVAIESAGGGFDVIFSSVSYAMGVGVQVELLSAVSSSSTDAIDLAGNEFANTIYGNAGANVLDGKGGNDVLVGLDGADVFQFTTALGAGNVDAINGFSAGTDKIRLGGASGEPFAALASGALSAASFVVGSGAVDANDYLIYNSGTGALLYDADGSGAGAAVQFATLTAGLSLTAADFIVAGPANNAPAITSGATASVVENSPASTIIYQVQATDADGDRITYALTGADASLLSIDANGAVRLLASPDFEAKSSYSFNVVAGDSGTSTAKAVTLTITNVAEGTPIFNEAAGSNDSIASAQAIDRGTFVIAANPNLPDDDLPSATIAGTISGNADEDFFSITLQAGEKLILDVDFTSGGLDSHLYVYGPNTVEIANNDDRGLFDPGSVGIAVTHNTDSFYQFRATSTGTYYFSLKSFQGTSSGNYQIHVSIGPPATAEQIREEMLDADIDALISGAAWNRINLTYGFPQDASQYPTQFDEHSTNGVNEFLPFSGGQQAATRQLIQLVANVTSLTFTELAGNPGQADLRYAMSTDDGVGAAHAYYPTNAGPNSAGGSSWYNTTSFNNPLMGNYAWMGILHETGHALGLEHGHEDAPTVSSERDSVEFTVMTYRSYVGDPLTGGYSNEQFGYPQTLMMLDIAALQRIYGANYAFNSGDSIYSWSPTTGEMSINGVGQGAPGTGAGGVANRIFMTIWDGGGSDTYDLSNYSPLGGVVIDLRPGEWTRTNSSQTANLGDGQFARGDIANALLFQGNIASAIENAKGGAGHDTLIANKVANQMTGNGGDDIFKWMSAGDAGIGAQTDIVLDFVRGSDEIHLRNIDANSSTPVDEDFTFIGTDAFHNVAGEIRYEVIGGNAHIFGDTDGNGIADMAIILNNVTVLTGHDFFM